MEKKTEHLIRVSSPSFVAGLIVEPELFSVGLRIVRAAPILRRYRSWNAFIRAASRYHWRIEHLT